jgi:uncharacterized SAM-binding protein YcdF (DUF218 family)
MRERAERTLPVRRFLFAIGIGALLLLVAGIYAFFHAGLWLVREDPLQKSQAIVVLSGGLPDRALAAAEIYRVGCAREIWLTQPLQPGASIEDLHLPYAGEEQYSRMVLVAQGVPPANIRLLMPRILNTADELHAVAEALNQHPGASAIVVTSKAHTRRVRALWKQVSQGDHSRLLVRASTEDPFDAVHWWRSTNDALTVVREYLGLLNAWAGLPLDHSK